MTAVVAWFPPSVAAALAGIQSPPSDDSIHW